MSAAEIELAEKREIVKQAREVVNGRILALREAIRKAGDQLDLTFTDEHGDVTVDEWAKAKARAEAAQEEKEDEP